MARPSLRSVKGLLLRGAAGLMLGGAVILSAAGCGVLGASPPPTPTAAPRATPTPQRATVAVQRDTIVDAVKVLGRIVSSNEADLSFRNSGRIREVYVQPGDMVKAGQVLAELDQRDLPWLLAKARVDAERQQVRIAAAQAKAVIDDTRLDAIGVRTAEIAMAQAQIGLERVLAGQPDAEVKKVESDLTARRADLDRARFDLHDREASLVVKRSELALKLEGPDPLELAKARADVELARLRVEQLSHGPRAEDVRAAEIALEQERTKLERLRQQPAAKPTDVEAARLEVQKAHAALDRVLADIDAGAIRTEANREAAVQSAQFELERAQNVYQRLLNAAPSADEVRAQEQGVQLAELALAKVKTPLPGDAEAARIALAAAQAKLGQLERGPHDNELNALRTQLRALELGLENARQGVSVAEANFFVAQARLQLTARGPIEFDVQDARNKVSLARTGVDAARARFTARREAIAQSRTVAQYDVEQLRRGLEQAQLDVQNYESQTGDVKIVAPFDGKIMRVAARPGDTVQAFMPLLNVSSLEGLVVKADIPEADVERIAPGMIAEMTMDAYPNQVLTGVVESLPEQVVGSLGQAPERATRIVVNWPGPGAEMGMLARVQITLLVKPDVLVVPNGAVRTVGRRQFVEYMDGEIKRSRNVETGITTDQVTEIVSGLQEGMVILAGQ